MNSPRNRKTTGLVLWTWRPSEDPHVVCTDWRLPAHTEDDRRRGETPLLRSPQEHQDLENLPSRLTCLERIHFGEVLLRLRIGLDPRLQLASSSANDAWAVKRLARLLRTGALDLDTDALSFGRARLSRSDIRVASSAPLPRAGTTSTRAVYFGGSLIRIMGTRVSHSSGLIASRRRPFLD